MSNKYIKLLKCHLWDSFIIRFRYQIGYSKMQQLQKYNFQFDKPLTQPYDKDGIYNAYYEGFDSTLNKQVLISQFRQPRYQRIITKHKRLQKLQNIKHKNISQIYNVILDKQNKKLFVVLEWCRGGSLYDYEKSNSTIDCDLAVKILMDLVSGLNEIHKVDQMHRYINMENVEFDEKGTPKLTFKCLYPKTYYLSPEDKQGNRTKESDLFSLGVLFYKILLGQTPFKGNSLDEQIRSVQEGAKFPKEQKMFSLSLPIEIKNLITGMTMFKSQQRHPNQLVIQQCKNYLLKMNKFCLQVPQLPKTISNKIFREEFIPIFTRFASQEEHIIIALHLLKHQFTKFHILKSKSNGALNKYIQDVLQPFKDVKNQTQVVPIYDNYIIDQQYLVIKTFYDNQGSLKYYLDRSGTIPKDQASIFIQKLLAKLKKYGKTHNHLTNQNILIKGGAFYINYPPFMTKQYSNTLKNSKNDVGFVAPEIKDGKNSENADAWSVAMLKYMLQNQQMPTFDKNGKVQIKNKLGRSQDDISFYQKSLVKSPQNRKGLFQPDVVIEQPEPIPQIPIAPIRPPKKIDLPNLPKPSVHPQNKKTIGEVISQRLYFFQFLQKHWTKPIRVGIKCVLGLIMLIFLFYWSFFLINGQLITEHSLFEPKIIHIRAFTSDSTPQIEYTLVTKTPAETYKIFYNKTLSVLRDEYRCVLNDYSVNSNVTQVIKTSGFTAYQVFGILFAIFNLIIFCLSLSKMDFPKVFHISKLQQNNFNQFWNWMLINMALASQISIIYLLYGSLFHMVLEPCLSKASLTAVEFLLKKWYFSFNIRYIWIYIGLVFSYAVVLFFIMRPKYVVHRLVKAGLVALYLAGAFSRIMGGSGGYVAWQKQSVFGKVGQLLLLIISILYFILDMVVGCAIKNEYQQQVNRGNRVNEDSMHDEVNRTQQNFLPD